MKGINHATSAATVGLLVTNLPPHPALPWPLLTGLTFATYSTTGLIPDLDANQSSIKHKIWLVTPVLSLLTIQLAKTVHDTTRTEADHKHTNGHRGFAHSAAFAVLIGIATLAICTLIPVLAPWAWWAATAVTVGCVVHSLGDMTTRAPVNGFLWPLIINGKRFAPTWITPPKMRYKVNSPTENLRVRPLLVAALIVTAAATTPVGGSIGTAIDHYRHATEQAQQ